MSLLNVAYASAGANAGGDSGFGILLVVAFMIMFYFLLWRPQNQRAKQLRELIANLKEDDEVVTNGGILGKVEKIQDGFLILTIAQGISINVQKNAVAASVPKGTFKG